MRSLRGLARRIARLESLPPLPLGAGSPQADEPKLSHTLTSEMSQKLVEMAEGMPVVVERLRERILAAGLSDDPLACEMAQLLIDGGATPPVAAPVAVDDRDAQIETLRNRIAELQANGSDGPLPNGLKEL